MLVTLGGLAIGAVVLGLLGHLWDRRERRKITSELFASQAALSRGALVNTTQRQRNRRRLDNSVVTLSPMQGINKAPLSTSSCNPITKPSVRGTRRPAGKNRMTLLLEDSLPQVLQVRTSLVRRMVREMSQHHRWLAVMTRYSETFPRSLRVLSLTTNIIVMLFMQALVYALSNPDDGTCANLASQAACLQPKADFSGGGVGKCSWRPQGGQDGGECSFAEPSDTVMVVLFVAMFSAVVSAPIAICLHKIIMSTLAAPVALDVGAESLPSSSSGTAKRVTLLQTLFTTGATPEKEKEKQEEDERQAREQLLSLQNAIKTHRATLSFQDRAEFDGMVAIPLL